MFFSSAHHQKKKKKKKTRLIQDWSNQAQFWQRRNGQKDQNHCRIHGANHQYDDHHHENDANHDENEREEMILVGIGREEDAFELLSWAISIAARPGDVVIAFYLTNDVKSENILPALRSEASRIHGDMAIPSSLIALKDLSDLKQVKLDARFASSNRDDEDCEMIRMAKSLSATMLVVSPSDHHMTRNVQRRGNLLTRKLPVGCSVVVVKDSKILFYKDNFSKEEKIACTKGRYHHASLLCQKEKGSVQYCRSFSTQFSCTSSPLWTREYEEGEDDSEDEEDYSDQTTGTLSGSRVWPVSIGEGGSPRGVLENLLLPSDSDISSVARSYTHCNSRKSLLSCVSSVEDGDESVSKLKAKSLPNFWRNGSIRRLSTVPSPNHLKKSPTSLDRTSIRGSFKLYVSALLGAEMITHEPCTPSMNAQQNWRCFSYEELALATNNFNQENMVGKGGHAEVYRGTLVDGRIVAVKRLTEGISEEIKEQDFLTELGIVAHVCHPNTTPLVGFCIEEGLYLIFEFSSRGSLATLLHGVNTPPLDWCARYKIAVGTARGIHYLHTGAPRRIIHRDIKASNILLDVDFEPQISDFGLAKWLPSQSSQLSVFPVEGTFGYLAPEYFMYGIIHEKTDVFAYGVLLLELITGRQPIDNSKQSLVIWAKPMLESSKMEDLVDPRLDGKYDQQEMQRVIIAANLCIQSSPICRPQMSQVLELLTDEHFEPHDIPLELSIFEEDSSEEYSSSNYLSDLCRHREIALQF